MIFKHYKYICAFLNFIFLNSICQMGPNEQMHNYSSRPVNGIDSAESDDEEMARLRAEGWRIGFGVEMRVAVAAGNDLRVDEDNESNATDDGQSSVADAENPPAPDCGYMPLPSSVVDEEHSLPATTPHAALNWLPTESARNNWTLPPPPSATDLDHIQHQPIDIKLDHGKVEEIKQIMSQISVSGRQPEWVRQIDDVKLAELVGRLKGKVTDEK